MATDIIALAQEAAVAWGFAPTSLQPLAGGLINHTFVVDDGDRRAVLQRLHPVFGADVNLDLEAVTEHLALRGMVTPRLIRTQKNQPYLGQPDGVWRALTFIDGICIGTAPTPEWARAGGALVGRFHRAVEDLQYTYRFTRTGVHDTEAHLARLDKVCAAAQAAPELAEARELAADIAALANTRPALPALRKRHCHGDLKLSNLMFANDQAQPAGLCLIDLDTLGMGTLAFELGDAMRSWCNPAGEDTTNVHFELPLFAAAMNGYLGEAAELASPDERRAIVTGLETVCIELAARFCVDIFDDSYFGWDATRFDSRPAHNLVRARGQLALARSVRSQRSAAIDIVCEHA